MLRLPLQAPPFNGRRNISWISNCLVDESACVPHRYHGLSDTFLNSLSIMYLFVSNLLLNIYIPINYVCKWKYRKTTFCGGNIKTNLYHTFASSGRETSFSSGIVPRATPSLSIPLEEPDLSSKFWEISPSFYLLRRYFIS